MSGFEGYAVFLHEQAIEMFGEPIKPYLSEGERGVHILCREVDTSGSFVEMTMDGHDPEGPPVDIELIVPSNSVRMIVSVRSDGVFGFVPRSAPRGSVVEPGLQLPPVGPTAEPASAPSEALPAAGAAANRDEIEG